MSGGNLEFGFDATPEFSGPEPLRLSHVAVQNFRGLGGAFELSLGRAFTLLVGANGAGKSSALNAVEWCLFGGDVAKKGCGIDERGAWEVAHRNAVGEISVALTFVSPDGEAVLTRTRSLFAKLRDPDVLTLDRGDTFLEDPVQIAQWFVDSGLPDWTVWKHSFCQHQELLRVRVTDAGERSLQLGKLLGLDAYQEVNRRLKAVKSGDLQKVAAREFSVLEGELGRALERPALLLHDLEEQLQGLGVDRTSLSEGMVVERTDSLIRASHELGRELGGEPLLPSLQGATLEDVQQWSPSWKRYLHEQRSRLGSEAAALRSQGAALDAAFAGVAPSLRRLEDSKSAFESLRREIGDEAGLERQSEQVRKGLDELDAEERGRNRTLALLRQALDDVEHRHLGDCCPVCDREQPGLQGSLAARVQEGSDDSLRERREVLKQREEHIGGQLRRLRGLRDELESNQIAHGQLAEQLRTVLPEGTREEAGDVERLSAQWKRRISELEASAQRVAERSDTFAVEVEVLVLLGRWRGASARSDAVVGDLGSTAEWEDLQSAVDEAAGLASDLEALGQFARVAQNARSDDRIEAVNQNLGGYFATITGAAASAGSNVRVEVKQTATKLTYKLVDGTGVDVTPVLNQAALNALSFALLFAQAEDRARRGLPVWVQLDDPSQSLDQEAERGLADAALELSARVPVLLATFEGVLSRRLADRATAALQIVTLPSSGQTAGARS